MRYDAALPPFISIVPSPGHPVMSVFELIPPKLRTVAVIGYGLSEAFYADAVRRVNLLTLTFALYFPAFERLRSTRSLA